MTTSYSFGSGEPGLTAALQSVESNIFTGPDPLKQNQWATADIVSTAVDAGNTPTTLLRAGLILGVVTSSGQYKQYSPTATDGSQVAVAVLPREINMLDGYTAAAANRVAAVVTGGPVKASALVNIDNVARKQLRAQGFYLDDDRTIGYGMPYLKPVAKAANYTVLATDIGTFFYATTGAVTFTLPALAAGLYFWFYNTVDANMTVASAAGDDIITDGDAAADSVAFSTASHKIGGGVLVFANEAGTAWLTMFAGAAPANVVTVAT